jgi:hypothetical protein
MIFQLLDLKLTKIRVSRLGFVWWSFRRAIFPLIYFAATIQKDLLHPRSKNFGTNPIDTFID